MSLRICLSGRAAGRLVTKIRSLNAERYSAVCGEALLLAMTISTETRPDTAPRIMVTDALGRRIITIDKPLFTLGPPQRDRRPRAGRRRLPRCTPRSSPRTASAASATASRGSARSSTASGPPSACWCTAIASGSASPTTPRSSSSSATKRRRHEQSAVAAASETAPHGGAARGAARARLRPRARRRADAGARFGDRRDRRRARLHHAGEPRPGSSSSSWRGRAARSRCPGRTFATSRKIPETVFATGQQAIVEDLLDGDLAQLHTGTVALGIRHVLCTPLRLVRYVERADERTDDEDHRRAVSRQPRARRAAVGGGAVGARDADAPKRRSRSRTRGSTARRSSRPSSSRS